MTPPLHSCLFCLFIRAASAAHRGFNWLWEDDARAVCSLMGGMVFCAVWLGCSLILRHPLNGAPTVHGKPFCVLAGFPMAMGVCVAIGLAFFALCWVMGAVCDGWYNLGRWLEARCAVCAAKDKGQP